MPRESVGAELEGKPPREPHFAVLVDADKGQSIALGPGSMWQLIDPQEGSPIPLILKSVSVKRIVFHLAGTDYTYNLVGAKPRTREALKRLKESGKV